MSDQLLHIHSIGYTANNNPNRAIRGGEEFEEIIPVPAWREEVVKRNATVDQTVEEMHKVIRDSAYQTKRLSERLIGKDLYTTCGNIWKFLFSHILYKEDDKGEEQLRTPALSWYLRRKRGIDCDDFSIFCSTILYNLNIPHYLRCAKYRDEYGKPKDYFQHVYVVVPLKNKKYITIDAVLDQYDAEKPPVETKDFLVMSKSSLNGIDVSVLSGIDENDTLNEISGVLSGLDFDTIEGLELEGLGDVDELEGIDSDEGEVILGAIYNHMRRTREVIRKNPHYISNVEDPQAFGAMLDYGLQYWNTDKRDLALGVLEEREDEINRLQGLDNLGDSGEETQLFYGIEGLGGVSVLGKVKAKKQFFKNIKKTVQKVKTATKKVGTKVKTGAKKVGLKAKKVAKKVARVIIKTNPLTIAARAGMLAAMKTNFLKIAARLKWGYLTEAEARTHDFDIAEWKKSKDALKKAENLFVNTLKGNPEAFKKAILTGRAGGLSGINEELGVVAAAAAGASLTAAMPFIKKLVELVKLINPGKLIAKVKANKLAKKQKKAETMPEAGEDAQSAQPDMPSEETDEPGDASASETDNSATKFQATTEDTGEDAVSPPSDSADENLPAQTSEEESESTNGTTDTNLPVVAKTTEEVGTMMKVVNWVKDNPGKSVAIAAGIILMLSPARAAIGFGTVKRNGKKNRGNKKKNPPRAISGVPKKKTKPKFKNNPHKGKRKGKGGGPKRVTL